MSNDSTGDSSFGARPPPPRPRAEEKPNPYASGDYAAEDAPEQQVASHYVRLQRHRGNTVMALGLTGAIMALVGGAMAMMFYICCPLVLIPLGSLGLSIPAWVMGQNDLAAMRDGIMDPSGREITLVGMISGIVGTAVVAVGVLVVTALIVIYLIALGFAISADPGV